MYVRSYIAFAVSLGLFGGQAIGDDLDKALSEHSADAALAACLKASPAAQRYRMATDALAKVRDPHQAAKFNCSGIGSSWQERAGLQCCAAFERNRIKNIEAAWTALQECGWRAVIASRRPAYEQAARVCLAKLKSPSALQHADAAGSAKTASSTRRCDQIAAASGRMVKVPNLTGAGEDGAASELARIGFTVVNRPVPAFDPAIVGKVIKLDPPPGTKLDRCSSVTLFFYQYSAREAERQRERCARRDASESRRVSVPNVIGFGRKSALDRLAKEFSIASWWPEYTGARDQNVVVKQYPPAGSMADRCTTQPYVFVATLPPWAECTSCDPVNEALRREMSQLPDYELALKTYGSGKDAIFVKADESGELYIVNGKGQKKSMPDWLAQRMFKEEYTLLVDKGLERDVTKALTSLSSGYSDAQKTAVDRYLREALVNNLASKELQKRGYAVLNLYFFDYFHPMNVIFRDGELGTITGTINGGGDFIERGPLPFETGRRFAGMHQRPTLSGERLLWRVSTTINQPVPARPYPIHLPSARIEALGLDGFIELAPSGVSAIAVLNGEATVRELETGATTKALPGMYVFILPGVGVSPAALLRPDLYRNLRDRMQQLPPVPRVVQASDGVTLFGFQPAHGIDNGKPLRPTSVFAPDSNPIYVWFRVKGHTIPMTLQSIWHYLNGGADRIIGKSEITVRPEHAWADFNYELAAGKRWPKGMYRVDILRAGTVITSVSYRVEERPASAKAAPAASPPAASITIEDLETILRELKFHPQRNVRKDGLVFLKFEIDGRLAALGLYGCPPGPCRQLLLHTGFKVGRPVSLAAINAWNREQRFVRAYLDKDGDPAMESDLVVTAVQAATIREWIQIWRRLQPAFVAHLTK